MRLELLNTGSELLLGSVLNSHVRLFAECLFPLGLRLGRQIAVPDGPPIREALLESFGRADMIFLTGGLGPTTDDITRDVVAELLGLELEHDEEVWRQIEERFARRKLVMSPRNRLQALRPREAQVLWNPHGTAPGLYLAPLPRIDAGAPAGERSPHLFLLPGPPRELAPMLQNEVLPILNRLVPKPPDLQMKVWRTIGLGESFVEEKVGEALLALGIELGYCARPGEVDVRVIGTQAQIGSAAAILEAHLADHLVSVDGRSLEKVVVDALAAKSATLAVAESCTGGAVSHRITNVPGASEVYLAGYVTYANRAKVTTLGVEPELIAQHGAVSEAVAMAMAHGARLAAGADFAIATTGVAGPGGGTAEKPVGTVFIGVASAERVEATRHFFPTDRERFKDLTAQTALDLLRRALG